MKTPIYITIQLSIEEARAMKKYIQYAEGVATYKTEEEISDQEILYADNAKRKILKGIQAFNGRLARIGAMKTPSKKVKVTRRGK